MPLKLIIGPARSGKKDEIIKRFVAHLGDRPTLLVPNETDAATMRAEILSLVDVAVGASVVTFGRFLDQLAKEAGVLQGRVEPQQRILILKQVIKQTRLTTLLESSTYPGFCKALDAFIGELGQEMNRPEALERAFAVWAPRSCRDVNYFSDLLALYRGYLDTLEELDLVDSRHIGQEVADAFAGGEILWTSPIFIHGFDDFTASQARIIDLLSSDAQVTLTLTYEDSDAFAAKKAAVEKLIASSGDVTALPGSDSGNMKGEREHAEVGFLVAAGDRAEVELVGAKILELIRADKAGADEIAVILRDPARYARTLNQVFGAFNIPYSLNEPVSFVSSGFGRAMTALLNFCRGRGELSDLIAYVRVRHPDLVDKIDTFEREMRQKAVADAAKMFDTWAQISGEDAADVPVLLKARTGEADFSDVLAAIQNISRDLVRTIVNYSMKTPGSIAGVSLYSDSKEINSAEADSGVMSLASFSVLEGALDGLIELGGRNPGFKLGIDDVYETVLAAEVRVGKEAEPGRVHVLRVHRSRGRSYRYVFVLGLNEGYFPKSASEDAFFDLEERRQLAECGLELATAPGGIAEERYLFYIAATRATKKLFLSYQSADKNGKALLKSIFANELEALIGKDEARTKTIRRPISEVVLSGTYVPIPSKKEALRLAASWRHKDSSQLQELVEALGEPDSFAAAAANSARPQASFSLDKVKNLMSARDTFSITELELFIACPFQWYFERVLKPQPIEARLDGLNKGSIQHATLEQFYMALPGRFDEYRPTKEKLSEMEGFILELFDRVFYREAADTSSAEAHFAYHEIARNLRRFVRAEATRQSRFVPRFFEASFGLSGGSDEQNKAGCFIPKKGLKVRGKIDRVDVDAAGQAFIIDYKSGETPTLRDIENGKSLQLPLYMAAVEQLWGLKAAGGAYLSISKGGANGFYNAELVDKSVLSARAGRSDEAFRAIISAAIEKAIDTARLIRQGTFEPAPDANKCRNCTAAHICGKGAG